MACPCDEECLGRGVRFGPATPVAIVCDLSTELDHENVSLEPLCDITTGEIVGYAAVHEDEATGDFVRHYFDLDLNEIPAPPANSRLCPGRFDFELVQRCYQEVDAPANRWTQILVVSFLNGVRQSEAIVWMDPNGSIQTDPPGVEVSPCAECLSVVGECCYELPIEDLRVAWAGDWSPTGTSQDPFVASQVLTTGETVTMTLSNGVDASASTSGDNLALSAGGAGQGEFTLSWDQPLVGPLAIELGSNDAGDPIGFQPGEFFTFDVPPDSIVPPFAATNPNTQHIITWNDVTGITSIGMIFDITASLPSGQVQFNIHDGVLIGTAAEDAVGTAIAYANTCIDPPALVYYDKFTGEAVIDPTIVPCPDEACDDCKVLCVNEPIPSLQLFTFDENTEQVQVLNGITGELLEFHDPVGGVDWGFGSVHVESSGRYYLYDSNAQEWHYYNTSNIAGGNVNVGAFAGDPIIGTINYGAYDPVRNVGYIGQDVLTRYEVNFNTNTVTDITAISGIPAGWLPSSLSIDNAGRHFITVILFPVLGPDTRIYEVNPTTGVATLVNTAAGPAINGSDYDQENDTGWYGTDKTAGFLYFWSQSDGSDMTQIGSVTVAPTMAVGSTAITYESTPFLRCYSCEDDTYEDFDLQKNPFVVENEEWVGVCQPELENKCYTPGPKLCYDTRAETEGDGDGWEPTFGINTIHTHQFALSDGSTVTFQVEQTVGTDEAFNATPGNQELSFPTEDAGNTFVLSWDRDDIIGLTILLDEISYVAAGTQETWDWALTPDINPDWPVADSSNESRTYEWGEVTLEGLTSMEFTVGNDALAGDVIRFNITEASFGRSGEVTPFYDCEGALIEYRDVLTDEVLQAPNLVDCNSCLTKSVTEVCYETERLIDAEITLHGSAWTIIGPNQATQTFELPDGSNVNFTLTRAIGGSEVSQGPVINGIETLNLTTPTNGPSTWGLVWDVPLTGRFTMLFDDFDNDGGVTINEQLGVIGPQAPDNAGDYQGNILNERVTFVWDTSLIGGTNVTFQIDNAGVQIADSINIAPITLTVPVEFAGAYPALASMDCNDIVTYYDANTLEVLEDPAIVPCEPLNVHWMERLCDRIDTITGLDLFFFNDADQEVQRVNAFTGAVEDSHTPDPAIDWGHGTVFDASGGATGYYYLYDNTAGEWHRYEAGNISAGSVNLGPFGGDPIVGSLTFGAFDPTTGLGYVGFVEQTRYEVDFNTSTITALPGFTGFTGAPSSLSVTETGLHYMTGLLAGAHTILHTVDVATGVCTPTGNFINIGLNGADYDQDTLSGFYGIGNNNLYHWTELNGSDLEALAPAVFSGTLAVGNTVVSTEQIEFQRVYHKDLVSGEVTRQDHDLEGADYEVQGVVERCKPSCDDPLYVQPCIETWSKLLRDENCVTFNRVYHKTLEGVVTYQDHDLSGNLYTPVGEVGVGVNCYDVESHIVEIVSGGTWTPASIPANHVLTGLSMNVIIEAVDSSVTDADGNIITNIPAGLSMSWNVSQDYNTLVPPQSIGAGTDGRMILNMTVRDEN